MTTTITPVILCGGAGTRLWPLSRRDHPKQFAAIVGQGSLFQQAALRLAQPGFAPPVLVTNADFRFTVTQQLAEVGVDPGPVLLEPEGRNTAAALLAATIAVAAADPDALVLAVPSDHRIADDAAFRASVRRAEPAARAGRIVTFGIRPDRPETGFGYLHPDGPLTARGAPLRRFVEKPARAEAEAMLASGVFLWNAGILLFRARVMVEAFRRHAPHILDRVKAAMATARADLGFLRLGEAPWRDCEDVSVDYAVLEKAGNLWVTAHDGDWSDLGGWDAVRRLSPADGRGVTTEGGAHAFDCRDTYLRVEGSDQRLVALGLDNVVAVAMPDAVLIASRDRTGELGPIVAKLRADGVAQADSFPRERRPWGYFETLTQGEGFRVKRIVVDPGASLSLQSHVHRAENWVVVTGTARVTIGTEERLVEQNGSVFIPQGARHRLSNPGERPMELIEVQTGSYLGEDDIIRYADDYARCPAGLTA
ncbi:mannose-1-phosphate guanylyltransferase/mannose-6-phosphate isomerase [Jannaschia rubra]|uniref:mannose-1-phosphate guanylyltransferase n=1 Tax=Jannaschia rubra TaxID=282197 RepID=A0A0M6XQM9_9RHOB|nr:mannose-1-phosphate guanylyltransferase/mannose-6-phosphate isomerase [Jannaschia rubra]CTQ33198.1 Alginate biosynthesis protein AlgA [Jannaschia rubra]SFF96771.1 mannose-1-phosphate guanylyltransferase (GDP) [Jannaschia rubra]